MADRKSLLLVDAGLDSLEEMAVRLRQMGFHALRTKTLDQALEALSDPRFVIGGVIVPPDLPALDLERALAAFRHADPDATLPLLAAGRRPDADLRARMRRAGVDYALWNPLDDNTLRFQANVALAGGGPIVATRRHRRVPTNWPVQVRSGAREKPAKLYSLSARGAFLATGRPSMPKALVHVVLPLPSGDLRVAAEVVMTNVPGNLVKPNLPIGMGIRFTGVADGDEGAIESFTEERAERLKV